MRFRFRAAATLLPLAIATAVVSCGLDKLTATSSTEVPATLDGFNVSGDSLLIVGDSVLFSAPLPEALAGVAGVDVEWTSDDATVASVSPEGRVRGVNPGVTNINAVIAAPSLAEPVVRSARIRVRFNSISMLPMDSITGLGGAWRLYAWGNNRSGARHAYVDPVYTLVNATDTAFVGFNTGTGALTSTCTPPANGFCRIVGKRVGLAAVRATFDGMTTTTPIRVSQVPYRVVFQNYVMVLSGIGSTATNPFTVFDSQDQPLVNPPHTWVTSNPAVATVNAAGVITAVGVGTARITLRIGDLIPIFDVRVVVPGAANRLNIHVTPSSMVAGTAIGIGVSVVDANGDLVPTASHPITLSLLSGPAGSLVGTLTANAVNGTANFPTARLRLVGSNYVIMATSPGFPRAQTLPIAVTPAPATRFVFLTQPAGGTQNTVLSPFQVGIVDSVGNLVPTASSNVTLGFISQPGGATLGGTTQVQTSGGIATFSTITLNVLGSYQFGVTGAFSPATSTTFSIVGTPNRVVFLTQPTSVEAGLPVPSFQVQVQDASGQVVGNATNAVTLTVNTACGQTPAGTLTVNAINGVATFNNVRLRTTCTFVRLNATSGNLSPQTSSNFAVSTSSAAQLVYTTQPSTPLTAGFNQFVSVQVQDSLGNVVTSPSLSVSIALGNNPTGTTMTGTLTRNTTNGNVQFNDLQITKTGAGYTLVSSSSGLRSATSNPFDVQPNSANKLAFITNPPTTVKTGSTITPAIIVEVRDFFDNPVPGYSGTVDMTMRRENFFGTASTLTGTTSVAVSNGRATFSNLVVNGVEGNPLVLNANVPGFSLNSGTSTSFTIVP